MKSYLPLVVFLLLLLSCADNTDATNDLLRQEPYSGLTDSIQQQGGNAELYYKRGALFLQNDKIDYAEQDLRKAWNLKKDEQYALGVANVLRRKHVDSGIAFLQKASGELPQSIALKIGLARGYQQKNELDKAIAVCDQVIAAYPNQLDALQLETELLQAQNKPAEALVTLEKAYSYAPSDAELAHQLAFTYAQNKNPRALSLCDSLIKADVKGVHAEPFYFKGVYYANTGNKAQALSFFNQAIQHDYNFLDAYMDKGNLLFEAKDYKQALQTFELATTISPTFADAYFWLAKTKEAMGNKSEAKLDYQRAYGLDKTLTEAKQAADKL